MPPVSHRHHAWLLAILLVACDGRPEPMSLSSPPEPGTAVVNREPAWTRSTRWQLSSSPSAEIGGVAGKGPGSILKVVGVIRLDDGSIVVANASSAELKFYDRKGAWVSNAGGNGFGRGTFRMLGGIQYLETGEIAAYDESLRSLSVFDASGGYVRELMTGYDARTNGPFRTIEGVFDDESVLIHQTRPPEDREGRRRSDEWFVRVPREGLPVTVTDAFPGEELVYRNFSNARDVSRPPFGRTLHTAVAPTRFYVGDDDEYAISAFSPEGALLHVVQLEGAARPVTEDAIQEYVDTRLMPNRDVPRSLLESQLRALISSKTMPAFSALRTDPDGYLWARDFDLALPGHQRERWNVFDPNGRYLGPLTMAKGFALMTVGSDYVAGVTKDEYGTERVRVYELIKAKRY